MADNIQCQVLGGAVRTEHGLSTVAAAKSRLGLEGAYTATVNGEPASDEQSLNDYQFVSFSKAVKGGKIS